MHLCEASKDSPELWELLNDPEMGVDQDFYREFGDLAAQVAVSPEEIHAVHHCRDLATLRLLVEDHGAMVNVESAGGQWPLKSFSESGDVEAVAWLLEHGAKPDFTFCGETALHLAAAGDHLACARLFLQAGANPNQKDVDGCVPMSGVRSHGMLEIKKLRDKTGTPV